jgi:ketosteroid isomerase-like protein
MSTERNVELLWRYFRECVAPAGGPDVERALETVDELLSVDFVMYYNSETESEARRGRERHKVFLVEHARVFPDDRWTVEAILADETLVACRWRIEARHAATGNGIDVRAADFWTIRGGRLAELRRFLDFKSLHEQMRRRPTVRQ